MMPVLDSRPRFLGLSPTAAAVVLIAVTTAFHLFYASWLPILPDETYYLQWSRHLDASYISKGPAVAYTIWSGTALFGANSVGIRFFAVMLSAGTAWQIFLLARRWYDDVTGLIAVLITSVVPIYAVGAVVMTIDPLSVFFWALAANFFSRALQKRGLGNWAMTGFAVGCGFLAKYLNALELLAFLAFLLVMPARRKHLTRSGFWIMLLVALVCTLPVVAWNIQHDWIGFRNLENRGHLGGPEPFQFGPLDLPQLSSACRRWSFRRCCSWRCWRRSVFPLRENSRAATARRTRAKSCSSSSSCRSFSSTRCSRGHLKCEPNWPAVSYLSLLVILASHWRKMLLVRNKAHRFIVLTFSLAWLQTFLLQDTVWLPLQARADPMSRVAGWREIAEHLDDLRDSQHARVLIADAYKEASVFSYYLPGQAFIYTLRHTPPANQYDMWPGYPTDQRTLWITAPDSSPILLKREFKSITWLERDVVTFRDKTLREYDVYLCENPAHP